jgi:hypothetical protein
MDHRLNIGSPECHKEVLTSEFSNVDDENELEEPASSLAIAQRVPIARGAFPRALPPTPVTADEDDISLFKRIVQEVSAILEDHPKPGASGNELEAIGLILGMFPLLISASEHYKKGFEPLQRWKRFRTDFVSFITSMAVEKALFDTTIHRMLMSLEIPQHERDQFILLPEYEGWQNSDLAEGLKKMLGPSHSVFLVSMREIHAVLTGLMSLLSLKDGQVSSSCSTQGSCLTVVLGDLGQCQGLAQDMGLPTEKNSSKFQPEGGSSSYFTRIP